MSLRRSILLASLLPLGLVSAGVASVTPAAVSSSFPSAVTVSDCEYQNDPTGGDPASCGCSGYNGNLPVLPGPSPCAYTAVTGSPVWPPAPTSTSTQLSGVIGYPFTSTAGNGAIIAFATTTNMGEGPLYTGSSTVLHYGKSMSIQLASTSSVNVGTLTGQPLYTAISSALMAACTDQPENPPGPASPTASATQCEEVPMITGIVQTDNEGEWDNFADLEIIIRDIIYFDIQSLQGMVSSIASSLQSSSLLPNNTWTPIPPFCGPEGLCMSYGIQPPRPRSITNIPGFVVATFTQDTMENPGWPVQELVVELKIKEIGGEFSCADMALIMDGLAALALVPGLEWLDFMAIPALGVSATCDGTEHAAESGE